jgi:hypothetical protein
MCCDSKAEGRALRLYVVGQRGLREMLKINSIVNYILSVQWLKEHGGSKNIVAEYWGG